MSEDKLNLFISDLLGLIQYHIDDSERGLSVSNQKDYFFGRLAESKNLKSDIKRLVVEKYLMEIK
jgi:hypothetical protein